MALRSARNAGMDVPKEMIDNAVEYIKRCYQSKARPDGKPENLKSACGYEPSRTPEYAMASAAFSPAGLRRLRVARSQGLGGLAQGEESRVRSEWYFYGTYYFAQGMFQRGGEHATYARKLVEETLLPKQGPDGSWMGQSGQERAPGRSTPRALPSSASR
jgi:hypothetical protein